MANGGGSDCDFFLGNGVDMRDPNPLEYLHKFRCILDKSANIDESEERVSEIDVIHIISSIHMLQCKASLSAKGDINVPLTLSVEGSATRTTVVHAVSECHQKITRTIFFKNGSDKNDSTYGKELYEWLVKEIGEEKVKEYLKSEGDQQTFTLKVFDFFKRMHSCTHYVSSVDAGAIHYHLGYMKSAEISANYNAHAGFELVGGSCGGKIRKEDYELFKYDMWIPSEIRDFTKVVKGKHEAAICYEVLPVYTLVQEEKLQRIIQTITAMHLQSTSDFYYIKCGEHLDHYVEMFEVYRENIEPCKPRQKILKLRATKDKSRADKFCFEKVEDSSFHIGVMSGGTSSFKPHVTAEFESWHELLNADGGEMLVVNGFAIKFEISEPTNPQKVVSLDLDSWETEPRHIKIKGNDKKYACVAPIGTLSWTTDSENSTTQFQLERVPPSVPFIPLEIKYDCGVGAVTPLKDWLKFVKIVESPQGGMTYCYSLEQINMQV